MQIVCSSIPSQGADTQINATYDDTVIIPANSLPTGSVVIRFIQPQYISGVPPARILSKDWVNDLTNITTSEGARRVEQCYTPAQQRAGALIQQNDILQYGTDVNAWPGAEQQRYTELQRGLNFIHAMSAAQQSIASQGILNPCDDQYWPAPIDPIQL